MAGLLCHVFGKLLGESDVGVEACSDSSAALRELIDVLEGLVDALKVVLELVDVGRELLAKGDGSGVLGVGSTDLDDVGEFVTLLGQGFDQA